MAKPKLAVVIQCPALPPACCMVHKVLFVSLASQPTPICSRSRPTADPVVAFRTRLDLTSPHELALGAKVCTRWW